MYFDLDGVDDLVKELENLGNKADEIAIKAVDEAAEIMDKELKSAIASATSKYGTGTLANSIHHNKPRENALGVFTVSTARGVDTRRGKIKKADTEVSVKSKGKTYSARRRKYTKSVIRNQDKLWFLEFGNSRQKAHPIIQKCVNSAEPAVLAKMQEVFEREAGV